METEAFNPEPAPGADVLVLAGDVDSSWAGLQRFRGWPAPVLFIPGNHEYDRRDVDSARLELQELCRESGYIMLDNAAIVMSDAEGRRVRFVGSTRWTDFDLFGAGERERAMRAGAYFQQYMAATRRGLPFDAAAVREMGLQCREWLAQELGKGESGAGWDATVAVTHFAPSIKSADPRYGKQPGTASFCNDDETLMSGARLWLHGHLHCQFDYRLGGTRVLCNARGHARKGEHAGFKPREWVEVFS